MIKDNILKQLKKKYFLNIIEIFEKYLFEIAEYRIKTESFLFFPSWLGHYTVPAGPEEKISIAFNIWPRGLLQSDAISKVVV